jgi:recombination protein RecA
MAPPFREAEFDIMYGEGISRHGDLLDMAVNANLVEKSGSWYSYNGERIGQGRENVKNFLKDNPDITEDLYAKTRISLGLDGEQKKDEGEEEGEAKKEKKA